MQRCPKCQKEYPKGVDFCPRDGSRTIPAPQANNRSGSTPRPRTEVGNYTLIKKLGEGGMGVVFEAEHKMIQKRVALKMLHADKANDVQIYERFKREAKISSQIRNPHIVDITDFGQAENGDLYLVMEYLEGRDLGHHLDKKKFLPVAEVQHILIQSTQALAVAHKAGVVHRDLKPDNVFLITKDGDPNYVKLLDFGIAKIAEASAALTKAGMIIGTPEYMAPEQCEGRPVDPRSDIYSLGIIAYHMFTGKVPFSHEHFSRVLLMHSSEPPPPMKKVRPNLQISAVVEATVMKCLEKRREDRYQSMEELLAAVNTWGGNAPSASQSSDNLEPAPTQIASSAVIMAQGGSMKTINLEMTATDEEDAATMTGEEPVMNLGGSMLLSQDDENAPTIQPDDNVNFGDQATIAPGGMMRQVSPMQRPPAPQAPIHRPQPSDTQPSPAMLAAANGAAGVKVPSTLDPQKVVETTALPKLSEQLIKAAEPAKQPQDDSQPSRLPIILGSALGASLLLGLLLYFLVFNGPKTTTTTPPPVPPPATKPAPESKQATPTLPTPMIEKITLTVKAKPAEGIEVRIEGQAELLGTLPNPIFVPKGDQEVKLEFSKKGFNKVVKTITPTLSQEISVTLPPNKKTETKEQPDGEEKEPDDPNDPIKDPFKDTFKDPFKP